MKRLCLLLILILMFNINNCYATDLRDNFWHNNNKFEENIIKKHFQELPWGIKCVNAQESWVHKNISTIKIGIIDSGVNFSHLDLGDNIKEGVNIISPKNKANDENGHGTHIAGIIAAENNEFGVVGINPKAEIYPIKVVDKYGNGSIFDVIEGIKWCIENDIKIINISLEIYDDNLLFKEYIDKATKKGIIIVACAGNNYGGMVTYPAKYEDVISVSAINENNESPIFNSKGKIDFCAPGVKINSTLTNSQYGIMSGTSMASAHVTGVASLLYNKVDPYNIVEDLKKYSLDLGIQGYDQIYGNGLLKYQYIIPKK